MVERWKSVVRRLKESLAVRNGEDNGPTKKEPGPSDVLLCDGEPPPSIEEIQSWGKSFDKLMRSTAGRKVFRDFLRCEYSEENILFWLACEELKRESNPDAVEEKARFIYEDYISILSPKEVSLDSRVREVVNRNMVEPTPHTFDEAQLQIYTLMHRDSYPRFVNSALYKTLAQVASSSSASSAGAGGGGGGAISEEEGPTSPTGDSTKPGDPADRRTSAAEEKKEEAPVKKDCPEKKEGTTEKKAVTWDKLETDKNEVKERLKETLADKNEPAAEKGPNETKQTQALLPKKDVETAPDKKITAPDKEASKPKDGNLPNNST